MRVYAVTYSAAIAMFILSGASAHAACSWTTLANGTIANADQVMGNFGCLAPTVDPTFTGRVTIYGGGGPSLVLSNSSGFSLIGHSDYTSFLDTSGNLGVTIMTTGSATRIYSDYFTAAPANPLQLGAWPVENAITILPSGNVGIGSGVPVQVLDVAGTIRQSGCTTAGTLAVNSSGDIICSSDARLKNILGSYASGMDAILRLKPVRFTYKPTAKDPRETFVHAGFIAQNVKTAIPEASARQKDGHYSLDTTAILAAAVNAIKELKADNANLVAQLANLRRASSKQGRELRLLRARLDTQNNAAGWALTPSRNTMIAAGQN